MFKIAITRDPGVNFASGLTTSILGKPDYQKILVQHKKYKEVLIKLGLDVVNLPFEDKYPDAYFVEDTAVVFEEAAIITNPGANERKGEEKTIEPVLRKYKEVERIMSPGTVDGGDVLQIDKIFYIGLSERTNREGVDNFKQIVDKYGYLCICIEVAEGLHLKSSLNYVGWNTILTTKAFAENKDLKQYNKVILDKNDEYAGNSLLINDTILTPLGFPNVKKELLKLTNNVIELNMSEVQKMDGGLTCMSLRF